MSELGRILIIACDAIVWMLVLGWILCVVLTAIGTVTHLRGMVREKDEFEKRANRDMAIMFAFFFLAMIFFTVITTLGALAIARSI